MKSYPQTTALPDYSTLARVARQREVDNALLVHALCGQCPSPAMYADLRRYVAGELAREQAFAGLYAGLM